MIHKNISGDRLKEFPLSDETVNNMASIFGALSDPTRIRIIHALIQGELRVHDLSEVLNMTQSAVSHQLRHLKNLRIVKRRKEGRNAYYSIDDEHILTLFTTGFDHATH